MAKEKTTKKKRGRPLGAKKQAIEDNNRQFRKNMGISASYAMKGNSNGTALKDPESRQLAYLSFCSHIANGYPVTCWTYSENGRNCCYRTMLNYIERYPDEFDEFLKIHAQSQGYIKWLERGVKLVEMGNASAYAIIMRNLYQWDREQQVSHTINVQQVSYSDVNPLDNGAND